MATTASAEASETAMGPRQRSIVEKLQEHLAPAHLEVVNESYKHAVPKGSETHFKVHVVSDKFAGMSLIQRHRMVNSLLDEEFKAGLHALSIRGQTPEQFAADAQSQQTPNCLGGSKHDPMFQHK
jgi:BolA protein